MSLRAGALATQLVTTSAAAEESPAMPFASSSEHLVAELVRIDLMLRMYAIRAREVSGDDAFRGLVISDADVFALFERPPGAPHWSQTARLPELESALQGQTAKIEARRRSSTEQGVPLRLDVLAREFALDRLDLDILLIAIAVELDSRYERLFGYLHDDVTRRRPSVDLVLALLCPSFVLRLAARERLSPRGPLVRNELVRLQGDAQHVHPTWQQQIVKVDDRILDFLRGVNAIDARLLPHARLLTTAPSVSDLVLPERLKEQLTTLMASSAALLLHLQGEAGTGKCALAGALAKANGRPLLVLDASSLARQTRDRCELLLRLTLRESRLLHTLLYVQHFDALQTDDEQPARVHLLRELTAEAMQVILSGELPLDVRDEPERTQVIRVHLPIPSVAERTVLWTRALDSSVLQALPGVPDLLARSYRISGGQIQAVVATASALSRLRTPADPQLTMSDLLDACQRCAQPRLGTLARKISTTSTWDDLVVSETQQQRLREVATHARHRSLVMDDWGFERKLPTGRGISVLFTGPPGTGKTLAASVIAHDLGLDLFQIDLSSIVSKYIGETEKQLARVFAEAEGSSAVLFFDEADVLFGKRSETHDARDRYANMEVAYLLQRMDSYEGVVILATNLGRNMDDAFTRRLRFIIDFALPDESERRRIWETILPAAVPKDPDLDLALLAKRFELAGGYIRNIALAATFLAAEESRPLALRHLLHAAKREYQKMGKIVEERMFTGAATNPGRNNR